jgi:hypothetical protein
VAELNRQLDRVEEAARAAEHLRHEVLFVHHDSPVTVPDLMTTEQVARTIVESGGTGGMNQARDRLIGLANRLERSMPSQDAAPEFGVLISALLSINLPAYLDALDVLAAARREYADQRRQVELLGRLRTAVPRLAELWEQVGPRRFTQGTARFVLLDELLEELPEADTADLVLLLGAGSLGTENLLVAAAAPRLLAVSGGFAAAPLPGPPSAADTVLSTLRRAAVPVIVAAGAEAPAEPAEPVAPPVEKPPAPVAYVEMPAPPAGVTEVPPPPLSDAPDEFSNPPTEAPAASQPFTMPAQREAPVEESDPSIRRAERGSAHRQAESAENTEPAEVETEYVVLPLGIVARAVESAGGRDQN